MLAICISVFQDPNISQIKIKKINSHSNNWLIIWWDDLKTEIQMLSKQINDTRIYYVYNEY